ncbi:unnamed protein product, partial [Nesidiocoris tenuis]
MTNPRRHYSNGGNDPCDPQVDKYRRPRRTLNDRQGPTVAKVATIVSISTLLLT